MDKIKEIDALLEKYFEGQTSSKDEEDLRSYFSQNRVADKHLIYVPMFGYFVEERQRRKFATKSIRKTFFYWVGAIACILLLLILNIKLPQNNKSLIYVDGQKISDQQSIQKYALMSIDDVTNMDELTIDSQIMVLDNFIDE